MLENNQNLVEDTVAANAAEIATTDENLSASEMYQQRALPSLARQIFSVVPMHGPTAALFNIDKKVTVTVPAVPAVAQVETATPIAANSTLYVLSINGTAFEYTSDSTATVAEITLGLTNDINAGSVPVTATDNGTSITLTSDIAGKAFTISSTGVGTIGIVQSQANVEAVPAVKEQSDVKLVRAEVEVYPSNSIPTGLTREAVEDIRNQYGKGVNEIVGVLLRGLSNEQENEKALAFLDTQSLSTAALAVTAPLDARKNVREISQRVNELILQANSKNQRTFGAYVVLPYKFAASFMSASETGSGDNLESGLFITRIGRTRYFYNPDVAATDAYVGLVDDYNPTKSAAVFSPYASDVVEAIDPDSGDEKYFIYNRYAITRSPLHVSTNEMMFKFAIS